MPAFYICFNNIKLVLHKLCGIALIGVLQVSTAAASPAQTIELDSLKQHYWAYQRLKDSLVRAHPNEKTAKSVAPYQASLKEQENQILHKENEKKQITSRDQYWSGVAMLTILLLCAGASVSLYLTNRQKKVNQELQRQKVKISTKNKQLVQLNRAMIQQNLQLEQLNRVKNQLLSIVSHDVRAPLRSIQGLVTLAKLDALSLSEMHALLDKLSGEVQHTSLLLENILNWAHSQMEGFHMKKSTIDLRCMAIENLDLFGPLAIKKQLTLKCTISEPMMVNGDEEMVKTVIRNLVNNAIKFSYPNGTITLSAYQQDDKAYFTVQDEGVGIKPEDLPKIFSDTRHTSLGTGMEKGTGIGLQVCKDFITQHQGNIWVESQLGEGTAFHFTLPVALEVRSKQTEMETSITDLPQERVDLSAVLRES